MSPRALPSGVWFSSWYVVSIDTGHIALSAQSSPRWSPAFKVEPVLSVSSFRVSNLYGIRQTLSIAVRGLGYLRNNLETAILDDSISGLHRTFVAL